jgi:hypothetical protein
VCEFETFDKRKMSKKFASGRGADGVKTSFLGVVGINNGQTRLPCGLAFGIGDGREKYRMFMCCMVCQALQGFSADLMSKAGLLLDWTATG